MIKNKIKRIGLATLLAGTLFASKVNADVLGKGIVEMHYSWNQYELFFHPCNYDIPSGKNTLELMVGKGFEKPLSFKAYAFWKGDNRNSSWLGLRMDFSKKINDSLTFYLQGRYFFGLNKESKRQLFLIPSLMKKKNEKISFGAMGYFLFTENKKFLYAGPCTNLSLNKDLSFFLYPAYDLNNKDYLLYVSVELKM